MKKLLFVFFTLVIFGLRGQTLSFTLINQSSSYSITCSNTVITLSVTANTSNSIQCTWIAPASNTVGGNPQMFSAAGNYTVIVKDVITNSVASQLFSIYQNTLPPTSVINPSQQSITCSSPAATFTSIASNPTVNIEHHWFSPLSSYPAGPMSEISSNQMSIYTAMSPGVHTVEVCDMNNGCCTPKTFTVTTAGGFPSFTPISTTNFSVGCQPNQTTLCISNPVSVVNGQMNFVYLAPGTSSAIPLPNSSFSSSNCTVTGIPGTWTLVTNDITTNCQTSLPLIVTQNTVAPTIQVTVPTQTINCNTPSVTLTCLGFLVYWIVPSTPPIFPSNTLIIGVGNGFSLSATPTTFTAVTTNTLNGCTTSSIIPMYQNTIAPIPNVAIGNPSIVTCAGPVLINFIGVQNPNSGSSYSVQSWQGPSPQASVSGSPTYSAFTAGIYTLTAIDNLNGCVGTKTILINQNTYNGAGPATYTTPCPGTVTIAPSFTGSTSGYSFAWSALPGSSQINGVTNTMSVTVSGGGTYLCTSTNNSNSCTHTDTINVYACVGIINNSQFRETITVHPNPASDYFYIDAKVYTGSAKFVILNSIGQITFESELFADVPLRVDSREFPEGIYFAILNNLDGEKIVKKLIISK